MEVRGQLKEAESLLRHGAWESNSDCQVWQQDRLPAEPSLQSSVPF